MRIFGEVPRLVRLLQYDCQTPEEQDMIIEELGNLVQPPLWPSEQYFKSPLLFYPHSHNEQHFYRNLSNQSNMILYNNVPQLGMYRKSGTVFYRSANIDMDSADHIIYSTHSDKKQPRKTLRGDVEENSENANPKEEKRLRRYHNEFQRRNSGLYEKQSDVGLAKCPLQQRQNKKTKFKRFVPNTYAPFPNTNKDATPTGEYRAMCSIQMEKDKENISYNSTYIFNEEDASVYLTVGLTEKQLYNFLIDFTLLPDQLFSNGYPELDKVKNQVRIWRQSFGKPLRSPQKWSENVIESHVDSKSEGTTVERTCVRCSTKFFMTEHGYLTKQRCCYHWGKIIQSHYTCCLKTPGTKGCTFSKLHVWNGTVAGINEPLEGFVSTKPSKKKGKKVFALDCEMCYTVKGLELCKVTILAYDGAIVYDYFVKPDNEVVDYNTRFSGVTESDVNGPFSKTFAEVQSDILNLVTEDTILVGHALDNDLRVLKLIHSKIVDTALVFPHERGFPFRYSLKHLMSMYLRKQIQTSDIGHSPYEDALSCLELIILKIKSHYGQKYFNLINKNVYS